MTTQLPDGYVMAADGLPARDQGGWARDKLGFLEAFQGPALGATTKKGGETHYVDLFAGPGRNVSIEDTGVREFAGSPIQAIRASFAGKDGHRRFGQFHFCNLSKWDDELLRKRVATVVGDLRGAVAESQVRYYRGDANKEIKSILRRIPTWAYLLVFADIEGPKDLPFQTLRTLKARHESVDLYVLYPSHMAIDRLLAYDPTQRKPYRKTLTAFFGTDDWLDIVQRRQTSAHYHEMYHSLRNLYLAQLRTLWKRAEVIMTARKKRRARLYDMIFAYDHAAAGSIAEFARGKSDQMGLFDGAN